MIQNLKVDLIYYKTNTDFEMEFNLCGCCRMRLLNDRVSDSKTFIKSLARAVSRSKIIIITAPLFGEEGVTSLVASAINKDIEIADNKTYGIADDAEISIIKDSTPLVTEEGYFGGCIIESGPQTMILLSDSKNVRKSIMQTLIHPYLEEVATGNTSTKTTEESQEDLPEAISETDEIDEIATSTVESEPETPDMEEDSISEADEQSETFSEDDEEILEDDDEDEEILEEDDDEDEDEDNLDIISLIHPIKEEFEYSEEYQRVKELSENSNDNADEFIGYTGFEKQKEKINIPIIIFAIFLLLAIAVLCYCLFFYPSQSGTPAISYVREIYHIFF